MPLTVTYSGGSGGYFYSIYILSEFDFLLCRVRSRVLLVPFSLPTTGPITLEEMDAYEEFKLSLNANEFSSAVGWVVLQGQEFLTYGKEFVKSMQTELREAFGLKIRNINGWASCLFFVKQVRVSVIHVYVYVPKGLCFVVNFLCMRERVN